MNHKKYFLIFYCQIILVLSAFSQELPPISNYGISDYQAGNQNWSIAQSENNYIYIGNNQGLLEFDGARWTLYPSPKWNPALCPIRIPTGLPNMVPLEPILVASTAIITNGFGFIFRVSHTWNTSAETKTIDVTSSTVQAMTADKKTMIATKLFPLTRFMPITS